MKFKDVAHLYIGCKVIHNYSNAIFNYDAWYYYTAKVRDGEEDNIRPLLYPLSAMTKEQLREWIEQPMFTDSLCKEKIKQISRSKYELYQFIAHMGTINAIPWLFKNRFDFLDLIESGEAIDVTTLEVNPYN